MITPKQIFASMLILFTFSCNYAYAKYENKIKVCTSAINKRFNTLGTDQYGNKSGRKVRGIYPHTTYDSKTTKHMGYGDNNNLSILSVVTDNYKRGFPDGSSHLEIHCITNSSDNIIGMEFKVAH